VEGSVTSGRERTVVRGAHEPRFGEEWGEVGRVDA
jgi:hypothetical protein